MKTETERQAAKVNIYCFVKAAKRKGAFFYLLKSIKIIFDSVDK